MGLICIGLLVLVMALCYRNKRDKDIVSETIGYYSNLASNLSNQLKNHRDLTTFLAHDLKSPLAGIISSAQALEQAGQALPNTYLDCLRLMQISGRANLRLLSNFIELIGDDSNRNIKSTFPKDRLELLSGLIESELIKSGKITWQASPWLLKTNIALRHFSNALAEIISLVCDKDNLKNSTNIFEIEEFFDPAVGSLRISFQGLGQTFQVEGSGNYPYSIAIQVLEKLGVSVMTIEQSEESSRLELLIPICEHVLHESVDKRPLDANQINAEALIEQSLKQVRSASLSVGSLSKLQISTEEVDEWIEHIQGKEAERIDEQSNGASSEN